MNRIVAALLAAATLTALPAIASAEKWVPINQRQANMQTRIDDGVRSGALTREEAVRLRQEFDAIARRETDYRRSGRDLSPAERADLQRRLDDLSRRIWAQKHDAQRR